MISACSGHSGTFRAVPAIRVFYAPFLLPMSHFYYTFAEREILERLGKQYQGFDNYLKSLDLQDFAQTVRDNGVKGNIITASDEVLAQLGLDSAIDRLRFRVLFQRELLKKTSEVAEKFPVDRASEVAEKFPVDRVVAFFRERKFIASCAAVVEENGIDGEMLLLADEEVFEELGVHAAGMWMIKDQFQDEVLQSLD